MVRATTAQVLAELAVVVRLGAGVRCQGGPVAGGVRIRALHRARGERPSEGNVDHDVPRHVPRQSCSPDLHLGNVGNVGNVFRGRILSQAGNVGPMRGTLSLNVPPSKSLIPMALGNVGNVGNVF